MENSRYPKTGSKEIPLLINLILYITKERHSILEKKIDVINTKTYRNLVGDMLI